MRNLILLFCTIIISLPLAGQYKDTSITKKPETFEEIYQKYKKQILEEEIEKKYEYGSFPEEKDHLRLERWAWYWRDRLNEDGTLQDPTEQWKNYKDLQKKSQLRSSIPNWIHEGPVKNTGGYWAMGRTTHIDFHPTDPGTFFVAAANGGIWKTTNNGQTYTSIGDNLPQQPVGIIIVDPRNPNTLYISIGEKDGWWQYGLGVYKSTDGGKTWNPTALSYKLSDSRVIYGMIMHPQNSKILMVASNKGIFKTEDGGATWRQIRTDDFSDIKYKIGNPDILYAAKNDYWGSCEVFKSTDGGESWNQITGFNKQKSSFRLITTPSDTNYIGINASEDGRKAFYLSKNGGSTFDFISSPPENSVLYISPNDPNMIYCGYVRLYFSYDGGFSWEQKTEYYNDGKHAEVHADHHYVSFDPKDRSSIYFCNDGGVHRYSENEEKWSELCNGLAITQFYKMAISTNNPPTIIGGSQDNGGWIKRSNGTWGNTNGGDAMWQLIDPTNSKIMYSEYYGGRAVYRSTDGFNSSTDIHDNLPKDIQGQWVTPFNLNPKNPKTFIIGFHEVFVSHDRGNTFRAISSNLTGGEDKDLRNVDVSPVDTNIIFASYANILYYTYNFGQSWNKVTLPNNFDITSIEFHPTDTNRIWVTRAGLGNIKVMESKDRGKTWKNISTGLVSTPALIVRYDEGSKKLFLGTDIGLFSTDVDKINWEYYGIGLPNTSVTDIEIYKPTRRIYISTFGRGFYSIDLPTGDTINIICPAVTSVTTCESQSEINSKFSIWKNSVSFTGGCNSSIISSNEAAPNRCGGRVAVTFTATSDCNPWKTCTSSFDVLSSSNIKLICPTKLVINNCRKQSDLDSIFNSWKNKVTFEGGCNGKLSNNATTPPNSCGGITPVTFTVISDCESPKSCTSTLSVEPAPPVVFICPPNQMELPCQSQIEIDSIFNLWKNSASFAGGCNSILTHSGELPPNACGGTTQVTFTITSDCEIPKTCVSIFGVNVAPKVNLHCPNNKKFPISNNQYDVDTAFNNWKNEVNFTGGCNGILTNSGGLAPNASGGSVTVTYTVNSDCESSTKCSANFSVEEVVFSSDPELDQIEIYPNPAREYLIINSKSNRLKNIYIEILDQQGRIFRLTKKVDILEFEKINIESLLPGKYLIRIHKEGTAIERKFEVLN